MIRDPVEITSFRVYGKLKHRDAHDAVLRCAFALASSYNQVPSDYPIFGEFLRTLLRLGHENQTALSKLEESYKPKLGNCFPSRDEACVAIFSRYNITIQEIESVEKLMRKIISLPAYVEHIVFDKLVSVDY